MDGWMFTLTGIIWTSQLHQSGCLATQLPVLNGPGSPVTQEAYLRMIHMPELLTFLKTCRTQSSLEKLHVAFIIVIRMMRTEQAENRPGDLGD